MVSGNFIGAVVSIAGSVIGNLGTNVQKYVHAREAKKPEEERYSAYVYIPLWWCGLLMIIFMSITDIAALAFAGQALVVASGGATTLIVNNIFAKYWHKEHLSSFVIWGVASVVLGATLLAIFAPVTKDQDLDGIMHLAQSSYFIAYIVVIFFSICGTLSLIASSWFYRGRRKALMALLKPMQEDLDRRADQQRVREKHMWRRMQLMRTAMGAILTGKGPNHERSYTSMSESFHKKEEPKTASSHNPPALGDGEICQKLQEQQGGLPKKKESDEQNLVNLSQKEMKTLLKSRGFNYGTQEYVDAYDKLSKERDQQQERKAGQSLGLNMSLRAHKGAPSCESELAMDLFSDDGNSAASDLSRSSNQILQGKKLTEPLDSTFEVACCRGSSQCFTFDDDSSVNKYGADANDPRIGLYRRVARMMEEGEQKELARVRKDARRLMASADLLADEDKVNWTDPFVYAACAGIIGSVSILFASITVSIVKTSFSADDGAKQWLKPGPYVFLFLMLGCVISQTHLLNKGLQLGEVLTVFPTFQAFFIGFGVVGGMVFYQQSAEMSGLQWGMNVFGAAWMLFGFILLITSARRVQIDAANSNLENLRHSSMQSDKGWGEEDLEEHKRQSLFVEIGIEP